MVYYKFKKFYPQRPPTNIEVIGFHTYQVEDETQYKLTYELTYPATWRLFVVTIREYQGTRYLSGLGMYVRHESMEKSNRFTFEGKSLLHTLFIALAIAMVCLNIYAFIQCVRMPRIAHKWFWLLFVLVGVGRLQINWTTGDIDYSLFTFHLVCAGFMKMYVSPLFIWVSFPVGAIVFLYQRARILKEEIKAKSESPPESPAEPPPKSQEGLFM